MFDSKYPLFLLHHGSSTPCLRIETQGHICSLINSPFWKLSGYSHLAPANYYLSGDPALVLLSQQTFGVAWHEAMFLLSSHPAFQRKLHSPLASRRPHLQALSFNSAAPTWSKASLGHEFLWSRLLPDSHVPPINSHLTLTPRSGQFCLGPAMLSLWKADPNIYTGL